MENNYTVINNESEMQFEVELEGEKAFLLYSFPANNIAFMHTWVPGKLEGKGIAGALAKTAFEYAEKINKTVVIYCPFVAEFIKKHPRYKNQLDPEHYKA